MSPLIELQIASKNKNLPSLKQLQKWVALTLKKTRRKNKTLLIRIVAKKESQKLNSTFRHKNKPTNVLSFPFADATKTNFLGDLVICAPIVALEAKEQQKPLQAHWAHMVIHGVLHLLGYDHIKRAEAERMEGLEIRLLAELGYDNPYEESLN